jgi:hypothetical protein
MTLGLQADAAFPPANPAAWVADLTALGCQAGAVYILGGGGVHYTPGHVAAALAAGKYVSAVVVPESSNPSMAKIIAAAAPYGFPEGTPLWDDVANGDDYTGTPAEVEAMVAAAAPTFTGGVYCQPGLRARYPWGLFWQCVDAERPTSLPAGVSAWQYGQVTGPSGSKYDLSLIDLSIFPEAPMTLVGLDPADPTVKAVLAAAQAAQSAAQYVQTIFDEPYQAGAAPWSNLEVIRRQLTDLGAEYAPASGTPPAVAGYTPSQTALSQTLAAVKAVPAGPEGPEGPPGAAPTSATIPGPIAVTLA